MAVATLWNLPVTTFPHRYGTLVEIFKGHFGDREFTALELGVFKADLLVRVFESDLKVSRYDGVDPYLGDGSDPYTGGYWKNPTEAGGVYEQALTKFNRFNQRLFRCKSTEFLTNPERLEKYDLIVVDGNHRYEAALQDMNDWWGKVTSGGMMLVDDYANVDHPGVTRAINEFVLQNQDTIQEMGYRTIEFQNRGKHIPIVLTFVYFQSKLA